MARTLLFALGVVFFLAPALQAQKFNTERISELSTVSRVVTLADYVPDNQDEKREILMAWPSCSTSRRADLRRSGSPIPTSSSTR